MLRQNMENQAEADKSRRISRKTKGLNPDAPRPPQQEKSKL